MVLEKAKTRWLQIAVHVGAILPLALSALAYARNRLGFDPIRRITLQTGRSGMLLLILSLACTPINIVFGTRRVLRVRRALGLYAFLYLCLHLLTFAGLDYGFDSALIAQAILEKRFVQVGLATFTILLPLAITSTKGWMKRLGRNWKRLHRLVYLAAVLDLAHFAWVVKAGNPRPIPYGAALALLLILRIPVVRRSIGALRDRLSADRGGAT